MQKHFSKSGLYVQQPERICRTNVLFSANSSDLAFIIGYWRKFFYFSLLIFLTPSRIIESKVVGKWRESG